MIVVGQILAVLALLLGLLLLVAVGVFVSQIVAYVLSPRGSDAMSTASASRGPLVVLVPAHDEERGIAVTLAAIRGQLAPGDRVLVVADNCADDTAAVARAAGAEVVERRSDLRGKGYALGFGIDHLRADPPDAVVIVDADCLLGPDALERMAQELARSGRPVQALYLMLAPADAGVGRRLAQFAWRVRNGMRPGGWNRLGMPCQLMGTGMAFSWDMLEDAQLANASIVEDMKLGIELATEGAAPLFCDAALVTSEFPDSSAATQTQRTRWEHGHLEMILREVPPMLRAAIARRDLRLAGLALDLAVPPLALLTGLLVVDALVAAAGAALGGSGVALGLAVTLVAAFGGAVLLAWAVGGRDLVRLAELLAVPWYVLAKLPVYARFLFKRQKAWVRTDRK